MCSFLVPKPFKLQMDNDAARCFANDFQVQVEAHRLPPRLCLLRDKEICIPVRVDTKDNLADIFTKILPEFDFA
jgi:hypothetical protein